MRYWDAKTNFWSTGSQTVVCGPLVMYGKDVLVGQGNCCWNEEIFCASSTKPNKLTFLYINNFIFYIFL